MKNIKHLISAMSEPASKEWFAKHGLPKSIANHPLKQKVAKKMPKKDGETSRRQKAMKNLYKGAIKAGHSEDHVRNRLGFAFNKTRSK